ncbi:hypothetical protein BJ322DRAFT_1019244 [Thelephora terrestris]|uniref:Uncharacterized protein n=1 Tax=Thelephora terrestris TaxID=56493 RepID=A0A9P6HLN5_9AGAM|nr:hypothetical protein BJ322DRAFT_1019244 [Thelephora terrestris]
MVLSQVGYSANLAEKLNSWLESDGTGVFDDFRTLKIIRALNDVTICIRSLLFSKSHPLSPPLSPSQSIIACPARSLLDTAPCQLIESRNSVWHPDAGVRSQAAGLVVNTIVTRLALIENNTDAESLHTVRRIQNNPIRRFSARLAQLVTDLDSSSVDSRMVGDGQEDCHQKITRPWMDGGDLSHGRPSLPACRVLWLWNSLITCTTCVSPSELGEPSFRLRSLERSQVSLDTVDYELDRGLEFLRTARGGSDFGTSSLPRLSYSSHSLGPSSTRGDGWTNIGIEV